MLSEKDGRCEGCARWYVVQSKRHREELAQVYLDQREIRAYLPRISYWPKPAVGGEIGPMFPGYLFALLHLPGDFYRAVWTPGVKDLVRFGEEPPPLPEGVVEFLRSQESPDGFIRCGARKDGGQEVRIVRGAFKGLHALVEARLSNRQRVLVLMHLLQRQTRVEVPEKWLRQA